MKQIMFSTVFPKKHPKEGKGTMFVASVWRGTGFDKLVLDLVPGLNTGNAIQNAGILLAIIRGPGTKAKLHTIRAGNRWKAGDVFQPKVWIGRPYHTETNKFCPPITVTKIWDFKVEKGGDFYLQGKLLTYTQLVTIAENDGLSISDFLAWFNKPFSGQIICWDKELDYSNMINAKP